MRGVLQSEMVGKLCRFGLVGGLSTLAYGLFTSQLVGRGVGPVVATALGYLLALPLNFLLQRTFAFRSQNKDLRGEFMRYFIVHGGNIAASMGTMAFVTEILRADYRIGIALTMTLVPILVFVMLDRWVFPSRPL